MRPLLVCCAAQLAAVLHPAMKCGFAVSFSSHEVAPERSQPALNSRLEIAARCHGQLVYSVSTGGASKGTEALRGAARVSLQLRRLSCSGSAAIPAIVPSHACGSGSGDRQQVSISVRLPMRTAIRGSPVVPVRVRIQTERGRDAHYWAPPAQIRTCPIKAFGSHLGFS